jgi:hypothetical protein
MKYMYQLTIKTVFRLLLLLSFILLSACMQSTGGASSSDMPEWVQNEPDMYPNTSYLSATGSASKAEQAKARALSNLAKIFEVQIREVSTTKQEVKTSKVEDIETVQVNQSIASTVNLQTDKMIQGARIAEQWQRSADLTYHALAVLDRAQAGTNIRSEMRRLDEETQYALDQQAKRTDALLQISDLDKANRLQRDRQTLQKTLKIIDVRGQGSPPSWSLAELHEQLQQALRSLPMQTVVKTDDIGGLDNILQGSASKAGFNVANNSQNSYQLSSSLDAQPAVKKDAWFWRRATLSIELIAQDGVSVLGHQSWPLKVSAGDEAQLSSRMRKAVEEKLDKELFNSVLEFAAK